MKRRRGNKTLDMGFPWWMYRQLRDVISFFGFKLLAKSLWMRFLLSEFSRLKEQVRGNEADSKTNNLLRMLVVIREVLKIDILTKENRRSLEQYRADCQIMHIKSALDDMVRASGSDADTSYLLFLRSFVEKDGLGKPITNEIQAKSVLKGMQDLRRQIECNDLVSTKAYIDGIKEYLETQSQSPIIKSVLQVANLYVVGAMTRTEAVTQIDPMIAFWEYMLSDWMLATS